MNTWKFSERNEIARAECTHAIVFAFEKIMLKLISSKLNTKSYDCLYKG